MKIKQFLFKLFFNEEYKGLKSAESNFERLCGHIESGTLIVNPSIAKSRTSFNPDMKGWDMRLSAKMGEL